MKGLLLILSLFIMFPIIDAYAEGIPDWVRTTAGWWSQGQISDDEFIQAIEYLIANKIITTKYYEDYQNIYNLKDSWKAAYLEEEEKSERLEEELERAERRIHQLTRSVNDYASERADLAESLEEALDQASKKIETVIDAQEIHWYFSDSYGNQYHWSMPIETYENTIKSYEPYDYLTLDNTNTGEQYTVRDYRGFIGTSFSKVIDDIYDNVGSEQFAYEIWYIVSQLTTYSYDIGEDPRWALETLSRGGGDCEDTTILIAEMLKSSSHTRNWTIKLVYFDADNPSSPRTMNHVAILVEHDGYSYIIESTAKDSPYQWPDGVSGWYFEI